MTVTDNSMLTEIRVEVAMLKQEVSFISKLFDRMEVLIEKVDSQYDTLVDKTSKIESNLTYTKEELAELYTLLTHTEQKIHEKIKQVEDAITRDITGIDKRIETLEDKTGSLLQSKWSILGGGAVVLWLFSNIDIVKKIITH